MDSSPLHFAICGAGFWAPYQLSAWTEIEGVRCLAICDPDMRKATALAERFAIPRTYDTATALLEEETLDFLDVITSPATHADVVLSAAEHDLPVICQKPMAPDWATAQRMVQACDSRGVGFFVHENWRWQTPLRALKAVVNSGRLGKIFRGRIQYSNSFPVFDNQPSLREDERFILMDMGVHILDIARMLFGEAKSLTCQTTRVNPDIKGEDVATVLLGMDQGATVTCEMSYASRLEHDRFPETFVLIEGERGSASLDPDYWVRVTMEDGTYAKRHEPPFYPWADPRYALAHSSCVACNQDILDGIRGTNKAETTAHDNLNTLQLVFAAYDSAAQSQTIIL